VDTRTLFARTTEEKEKRGYLNARGDALLAESKCRQSCPSTESSDRRRGERGGKKKKKEKYQGKKKKEKAREDRHTCPHYLQPCRLFAGEKMLQEGKRKE